MCLAFYRKYPGVAQLVARLLWEQDAGRSSRPTRTIHSLSDGTFIGEAAFVANSQEENVLYIFPFP